MLYIQSSHDELEIFPADDDDDEFDTKSSKRKHYYTETCYYKGRLAAVKRMETRKMSFERNQLGGLDQVKSNIRRLTHSKCFNE